MRVVAIHLFKYNPENCFYLSHAEDLSFVGIFQRKIIREHVNFASRTCAGRVALGNRTAVHLENDIGICYVAVHPKGIAGTVITDTEYPQRVAFSLLYELFTDFFKTFPTLDINSISADMKLTYQTPEQMLKKYQEPAKADKLMQIQNELEEVQDIMHKNIDEVLKRGETLESLMAKSQDLSSVSYNFYKKAKSANKCCKLL